MLPVSARCFVASAASFAFHPFPIRRRRRGVAALRLTDGRARFREIACELADQHLYNKESRKRLI
jgi:hypothetical protein